jgi:hypothetical protein
LLDSLETFLSTFQADLSAVSGQISDLQGRSKDIERRLGHRRVRQCGLHLSTHYSSCAIQKIERPLASLLTDVCVPPALATLILDSDVGEPWLIAIPEFERALDTVAARSRVKAARDMGEVAEGLRIVV